MIPPVFSRPGGKEKPALELLSTPSTLGQRPGGGGEVVPIVSGSQESWGLSLLVAVRRVGVRAGAKWQERLGVCSVTWGYSGEATIRFAFMAQLSVCTVT